ncbi:MAG: DUF3726 domain-containing protein [Geminicoccaceae bacterium]
MTQRSLGEIDTTVRKAAIGSGAALGLAEDLGRYAAWLAARHLPGLQAALCVLEAFEENGLTPLHLVDLTAATTALPRGQSALMVAPFVQDTLTLHGQAGQSTRIELPALTAPLLCLPAAAMAAQTLPVTVQLRIGCNGDAFEAHCRSDRVTIAGTLPVTIGDVSIQTHDRQRAAAIQPPSSSDPLGQAWQTSVTEGVPTDDTLWHALSERAARTMVPASATSRALGAGAGAIDND